MGESCFPYDFDMSYQKFDFPIKNRIFYIKIEILLSKIGKSISNSAF